MLAPGVLDGFEPASREVFRALGREIRLVRDEILMLQYDPADRVVLVQSGLTEVVIVGADGTERFRTFRGPGSLVGELGAMYDEPRTATVRVVEPGTGLVIAATSLRTFLDERPDAHVALARSMRAKIAETAERDARYRDGRPLECVARVVADHLDQYGPPPGSTAPMVIDAPLTAQRIGDLIDRSASLAEKLLKQLESKGLLRTGHRERQHRIRVVDRPGLLALADF